MAASAISTTTGKRHGERKLFPAERLHPPDRSNTRNQDYTNLPYGALTKGADYWEPNGVGNGGAALSPCPAGSSSVNAGLLLSGLGSGNACAVNTADGLSLHPHEERISGKSTQP